LAADFKPTLKGGRTNPAELLAKKRAAAQKQ